MNHWIIVREGSEIVTDPDDMRLVDIVQLTDDDYNLDKDHPDIFSTKGTQAYQNLLDVYKDKLWPNGNYHILRGGSTEDKLTTSLLLYLQE